MQCTTDQGLCAMPWKEYASYTRDECPCAAPGSSLCHTHIFRVYAIASSNLCHTPDEALNAVPGSNSNHALKNPFKTVKAKEATIQPSLMSGLLGVPLLVVMASSIRLSTWAHASQCACRSAGPRLWNVLKSVKPSWSVGSVDPTKLLSSVALLRCSAGLCNKHNSKRW